MKISVIASIILLFSAQAAFAQIESFDLTVEALQKSPELVISNNQLVGFSFKFENYNSQSIPGGEITCLRTGANGEYGTIMLKYQKVDETPKAGSWFGVSFFDLDVTEGAKEICQQLTKNASELRKSNLTSPSIALLDQPLKFTIVPAKTHSSEVSF